MALLGIPAFAQEQEPPPEKTVYITNTGKKYHVEDCRALDKSKKEVTISEAKRRGYTPCGICKPRE